MSLPFAYYFCANCFKNGDQKQIEGTLLAFIFYFYSGTVSRHFYQLALVNFNYAICIYLLCFGNGYRVINLNYSLLSDS